MTHFDAPLFLQILGYFAWADPLRQPILHLFQLAMMVLLSE